MGQNLSKFLISGQDPQFQNHVYELDLLSVPNFIALAVYFLFGTKFSWNEVIDTCFNVEYVLLDRNFDFLSGYNRYLMVTARYCSFPLLV